MACLTLPLLLALQDGDGGQVFVEGESPAVPRDRIVVYSDLYTYKT
jgi:hypothetical protein